MDFTILENLRKKFLDALNALGFFREEQSPKKKRRNINATTSNPADLDESRQGRRTKEVLDHKGSGYMGKGSVNTDATTFNRLRKEEHRGRQH